MVSEREFFQTAAGGLVICSLTTSSKGVKLSERHYLIQAWSFNDEVVSGLEDAAPPWTTIGARV